MYSFIKTSLNFLFLRSIINNLPVIVLFLVTIVSSISVFASPIILQCRPKQISHNPGNDVNPDIHGNLIAWRHIRSDRREQIYMYDVGRRGNAHAISVRSRNGKLGQPDFKRCSPPKVSKNRIVFAVNSSWVAGGTGGKNLKFRDGWGVFLYDTRSKRLHMFLKESKNYWIYYWEGNQLAPDLSNGRLVYTLNGDIVLRDPIRRRITNTKTARNPDIRNNKIVWQDRRNGNWDIYLYDIGKNKQQIITTNVADQVAPAIFHDKIVWQDKRGGIWNIYMHDLASKKTRVVAKNKSKQMFPTIHRNWIAWSDDRRGNWDIYVYSIRTGRTYLVADHPADQLHPRIYDNTIVWQDKRNGNWDIFMCTLKETRRH